ncbi:hypothetical protein J31TS6_57350 [Brevibacillus reuszeri]|uniref:hypothetical protein n=1 Tax=Brevibacillus reuszeri TaxID=54915 RepID=UPI001B110158|nr:hypothetical protein [Brevibacillus reuszeri]GIO09707.1 hypothetical protein J31TS6_57350 [Brevibacillus reuszeri]
MDIKTLEYMEQRAKRGRELVNEINALKNNIITLKSAAFKCIDININSAELRLTGWGAKQVPNTVSARVEACMLNVYIDEANEEIKRLEQELAEL